MPKQRMWLFAKRLVALASLAVVIYVVIGSLMFDGWWYEFFWHGGFRRFDFIASALGYLVDEEFALVLGIIIACAVAVVLGTFLRRRLFSITDKFAWLIVFLCCVSILVDAVVLRHTQGELDRELANILSEPQFQVYNRLKAAATPPKIQPPIYFQYIDNERVESLFGQMKPEMEEKERKITDSHNVKAKAEAGVGGSGVGLEAGKSGEVESVLRHNEQSPDRKCVEVMQYVQRTSPRNYYSSETDWYLGKAFEEVAPVFKAILSSPPETWSGLDLQRLRGTLEKREQWERELQTQLRSLTGFIFIDGDFSKSVVGDRAVLMRKFSRRPFSSSFRVLLPKNAFEQLPDENTIHLRVFGHVTSALGGDGFVNIQGIAVY